MCDLYSKVLLMLLLSTCEGFIRKLRHFDNKIECFAMDNVTGTIYVQVERYHVMILDRELSLMATKYFIDKSITSKGGDNATNGSVTAASPHKKCVLGSVAIGLRRTQIVPEIFIPPLAECGSQETSTEKVLYSATSGLYKYHILVAKDNNGVSTTRIRRQLNDANCLRIVDFGVRCKQPNFKDVNFVEATSAVVSEKGNGSSSLFVSFAALFQSRTYHVVCEYELNASIEDIFNNTTVHQAASSAIWQSSFNITALRTTNLENKDVLIISQRNQVRMLWLPLGKSKDMPQPLLDNEFRRGRSPNSDVYVTPDVLGVLPNGKTGEIYIANDSSIYLLKLDKCSQKLNCTDCLSGASYCGWCPARSRCTFEQLCTSDNANDTQQNWRKSNLGGHEVFCKSDIQNNQLRVYQSENISLLTTYLSNRPHVFLQEVQPAKQDTSEKFHYREKDHSADIVLLTAGILVILLIFLIGWTYMKVLKIQGRNTAVFKRIKSRHVKYKDIKSYRKLYSSRQREREIPTFQI